MGKVREDGDGLVQVQLSGRLGVGQIPCSSAEGRCPIPSENAHGSSSRFDGPQLSWPLDALSVALVGPLSPASSLLAFCSMVVTR